MIESASFSGPVQATLVVGLVLVQAIALYVGYGALERVATPLIRTITNAR